MNRPARRLLTALALGLLAAVPATAGAADIHKLNLKAAVLNDPQVSADIKGIVRAGGFEGVDAGIYGDLTGDGQADVVVPIASGGTAGTIAYYVYSYHFGALRDIRARNSVYKIGLRIKTGNLVVTTPVYGRNDPNCCPSRLIRQTLHFNGTKFVTIRRVIVRQRF